MKITNNVKVILQAALRLEREILNQGDADQLAELQTHGLPWSIPSVLSGAPTHSQAVSLSRTIRAMRDACLVQLTRWQDTQIVSNFRLTDAGRRLAEALALELKSNNPSPAPSPARAELSQTAGEKEIENVRVFSS
jgi:hypothetical protein